MPPHPWQTPTWAPSTQAALAPVQMSTTVWQQSCPTNPQPEHEPDEQRPPLKVPQLAPAPMQRETVPSKTQHPPLEQLLFGQQGLLAIPHGLQVGGRTPVSHASELALQVLLAQHGSPVPPQWTQPDGDGEVALRQIAARSLQVHDSGDVVGQQG
jgi:hypothetical protein